MSKEAIKLALEALEAPWNAPYVDGCDLALGKKVKAITALREALAEPQEKYRYGTPLLDAMTGKAQQALDKMAENARELGLDYESAQQEPVAWMYPDDYERMTTSETFCTVYSVEVGSATRGESTVALYTSPPAQRKPLPYNKDDMEGLDINQRLGFKLGWKSAEEAHGIKEKNT